MGRATRNRGRTPYEGAGNSGNLPQPPGHKLRHEKRLRKEGEEERGHLHNNPVLPGVRTEIKGLSQPRRTNAARTLLKESEPRYVTTEGGGAEKKIASDDSTKWKTLYQLVNHQITPKGGEPSKKSSSQLVGWPRRRSTCTKILTHS